MLVDVMTSALRAHGGRIAVADRRTRLGYAELDRVSGEQANVVRALLPGVDRPRVGIQAGNSAAYVVAYVALLKAGCVPFLIDRVSGPRETAAVQGDCGLDLLVHEEETPVPAHGTRCGHLGPLLVSRFASLEERPELHEETEVCRFTSGSTGRPSCIEFRGRAVHRAAANWAEGTGLTGGDTILCFAALSNGLAFNTSLLSAFLVGAPLHLASGLPTAGAVSRTLAASGATRLVGFPALYESLVRRPADRQLFARLRMAVSSAAPLDPGTKREFTERTGVPLHNYFGVAEAGPLTFAADPTTTPGLGRPLPGVVLRAGTAGAPGVVEVHSESMGTRYLNVPGLLESRTGQDGYYRTGDIGYLAEESLVLTGRTSQVINIGGRKVDATEVTEVLRSAEGVRDAVVLEVTDRHGASALAAVVAADPGLDPAGPRKHLAASLAPYKTPSLMRIVPEIPRGSAGKPATALLRSLFDVSEETE
ncbi:class I adenylate-forming enzyme family protein [Streptomyces albidoflavus]|uniref:class I adenylate-forming enzyme family protein n=1 Tax=Streptomyces albidoflavus TaxID=1886 RepID=UPI00101EC6DF|nr:class I adenylate-forming enzyme family protein [Streptomyces albidoflavus]RZE11804.1 long-chain fatty acid--CoA ligase [Streptomyces albidoflavus]